VEDLVLLCQTTGLHRRISAKHCLR